MHTPLVAASISASYWSHCQLKTYSFMENIEPCVFTYWLRDLKLISKIFITMKVSLGVPLLDLCLVTIATQLSKITQFILITNVFWKENFTTESVFWYQVNTKIGLLKNCEPQPDMIPCVPLGHCYTLNVDIINTLYLISNSWHFTFLKQCNIILSLNPHKTKTILPIREKDINRTTISLITYRGFTHIKSHHPSSPLPPNKSRRYTNPVFFNSVTPSWITTSGISKLPQVRFFIVWSRLHYFTATTNSMHLQSTHTPH